MKKIFTGIVAIYDVARLWNKSLFMEKRPELWPVIYEEIQLEAPPPQATIAEELTGLATNLLAIGGDIDEIAAEIKKLAGRIEKTDAQLGATAEEL
jgi:hypothetical protein